MALQPKALNSFQLLPIPIPTYAKNTVTIDHENNGSIDEYQLLIYIDNKTDAVAGDGSGKQDQLQGLSITANVTVNAKQK